MLYEQFNGLTYVSNFLGEYTGLLTTGLNGSMLVVFVGKSFTRENIGGNVSGRWFYDPVLQELFASNDPTYELQWFDGDFGQNRIVRDSRSATNFSFNGNYVYVPDVATIAPTCRLSDSDGDVDIDLHDFANFQNCWTGPHE